MAQPGDGHPQGDAAGELGLAGQGQQRRAQIEEMALGSLRGLKDPQIRVAERPAGHERGEDGEQRDGQAGADQSASSNSSFTLRK